VVCALAVVAKTRAAVAKRDLDMTYLLAETVVVAEGSGDDAEVIAASLPSGFAQG
jgi:hypothetical protein